MAFNGASGSPTGLVAVQWNEEGYKMYRKILIAADSAENALRLATVARDLCTGQAGCKRTYRPPVPRHIALTCISRLSSEKGHRSIGVRSVVLIPTTGVGGSPASSCYSAARGAVFTENHLRTVAVPPSRLATLAEAPKRLCPRLPSPYHQTHASTPHGDPIETQTARDP